MKKNKKNKVAILDENIPYDEKKEDERMERIHGIWWKFERWLSKNFGDENWHKNLVGWEAIQKVEKYAKRNKDIKIIPCDDDMFSSSILVVVPHFDMGKSVIFIPQNTTITNKLFLYPNHENMLIEALTSIKIKDPLEVHYRTNKADTPAPKPVKKNILIPAEYRHQLTILNMVMQNGGNIKFREPFCNVWNNISQIKGIYYDKKVPDYREGWRKYANGVKKEIGAKNHFIWIRDYENKNGDVVGFLAFFDKRGKEVKMHGFRQWSILKKYIENKH